GKYDIKITHTRCKSGCILPVVSCSLKLAKSSRHYRRSLR
ncbi:hypothetical protein pipiens_020270, partial [Culex pipiens pipiens]